jgi:hypothetical protein
MRHAVEKMGRKNRQIGENIGKAGRGGAEGQHDRGIVDVPGRVKLFQLAGPRISGGWIPRGLEGPGHVSSGGRLAIMPGDSSLEMKGEPGVIGGPFPTPSQVRPRGKRAVVPSQGGEEDVTLDLARQGVDREQWVDALEICAGGEENGLPPMLGARSTGGAQQSE